MSSPQDGAEAGAIPRRAGAQHSVDAAQELAHDGDDGLKFGEPSCDELIAEGTDVVVSLDEAHRRHEERASEVSIAGLGDGGWLAYRGARSVMPWIERGMGDPLTGRQVVGERGGLGEDRESARGSDSWYRDEELLRAFELRITTNELERLVLESFDFPFEKPQVAPQTASDVREAVASRLGGMEAVLLCGSRRGLS